MKIKLAGIALLISTLASAGQLTDLKGVYTKQGEQMTALRLQMTNTYTQISTLTATINQANKDVFALNYKVINATRTVEQLKIKTKFFQSDVLYTEKVISANQALSDAVKKERALCFVAPVTQGTSPAVAAVLPAECKYQKYINSDLEKIATAIAVAQERKRVDLVNIDKNTADIATLTNSIPPLQEQITVLKARITTLL